MTVMLMQRFGMETVKNGSDEHPWIGALWIRRKMILYYPIVVFGLLRYSFEVLN